ncbi:hypothetical protein [Anaerosporobacter sp.]|uniref:hypothetical protein n=1 Tax=Anaerosporobacter sp. TaxID=1872529 RepID=UPI00286EE3AF|nr:hypothetical protein [Anaerosporobacter sp.]
MPVNMMTDKIYKVDYDAWNKEISAMPIFNNPDIQKMYIDKWMQELKEQDMLACNQYYDQKTRALILKEKAEAPENFQLPILYKSNNMYIHFRVSRIIQMLEYSQVSSDNALDIQIDEFKDLNRNINWTSTSDNVRVKSNPIIMAPLTLGKYYKWIVVDGNHRITDAISKRVKIIKAFCLDVNLLVQSNMFCTGFDKLLYIFQNESVALATFINKDGYSDEDALKLSYFCSGNVQYYE